MTDKETLYMYRLNLAEETLQDLEKMLKAGVNPRSIINRAYYSAFYIVLALFLKMNIRIITSKHIGVISIFDKKFIHTDKIEKKYSQIFHRLFDFRQECDYKDLIKLTKEDAVECINNAKEFFKEIKDFIGLNPDGLKA